MIGQYPYWDVSWLVATIFTLGSLVWVANAFFAYLPLAQPSTLFNGEILIGGGVSAFVGATIFEIGSVLLIIEAVNENQAGCFGMCTPKQAHDRRYCNRSSHNRHGKQDVISSHSHSHNMVRAY